MTHTNALDSARFHFLRYTELITYRGESVGGNRFGRLKWESERQVKVCVRACRPTCFSHFVWHESVPLSGALLSWNSSASAAAAVMLTGRSHIHHRGSLSSPPPHLFLVATRFPHAYLVGNGQEGGQLVTVNVGAYTSVCVICDGD